MSILNKFDLNNKVAIVTGASRGLGQSMAVGLAEAGCDIVGISYSDSLETKAMVEKLGRKYLSIAIDLIKVNQKSLNDIVDQVVQTFGHIDILVNNAGIIRRNDALAFSENDWDDVLNINLKTVFFFSQAVAKQFVKQKTSGKIINIASMLSYQGGIRVPSYTASKSGVKGLTMALANEWASYGININAIAPGYMATDNTQALREDSDRAKEILNRIPAKRWGTPKDLVGTCIFLASDLSNYINGFTIAVDGGWLAR